MKSNNPSRKGYGREPYPAKTWHYEYDTVVIIQEQTTPCGRRPNSIILPTRINLERGCQSGNFPQQPTVVQAPRSAAINTRGVSDINLHMDATQVIPRLQTYDCTCLPTYDTAVAEASIALHQNQPHLRVRHSKTQQTRRRPGHSPPIHDTTATGTELSHVVARLPG